MSNPYSGRATMVDPAALAEFNAGTTAAREADKGFGKSPATPSRPTPIGTVPASTPEPDGIQSLLHAAKSHSSKRAQANRVLDGLGRLRDLLAEDEAKHAAKREAEAAKVAAKAEVARLERALAAAKAKLRGSGSPTTIAVSGDISAAELRAWAKTKGIECPAVPAVVREQYAAENDEAAS